MAKASKIDKEIGQKIEFNRLLKRRSRKWLGDKIERSYHQVQNYEYGKNRVSASTLLAIAEALKAPIANFFPNKNDK
jgi:transcriptional regulator with XRE-family HTH domain